jgi:hypothetical protein
VGRITSEKHIDTNITELADELLFEESGIRDINHQIFQISPETPTSEHHTEDNDGRGTTPEPAPNWNTRLKKSINSKLLTHKQKRSEAQLADKRQELIALQIKLAERELQLKEAEIKFITDKNERHKIEHEKNMELLNLKIRHSRSEHIE